MKIQFKDLEYLIQVVTYCLNFFISAIFNFFFQSLHGTNYPIPIQALNLD